MAFSTYDPFVVVDPVTGRPVRAAAGKITDPDTGAPVALFDMNNVPINFVFTNAHGYCAGFKTTDSFESVLASFGGVVLRKIALEVTLAAKGAADSALSSKLSAQSSAQSAADSKISAQMSADSSEDSEIAATTVAGNLTDRVEAVEALGGLSPQEPIDGQTADLIAQKESLTRGQINAVIADEVAGPGLSPLFLPTLPIGAQGGAPANIRTGLSPQHMTGGGPEEELNVPVFGLKGQSFLTSSDTAKVDAFGTGRWMGAVTTGSNDFHIEVAGTPGGGVINLRDPLPMSVDGFLSPRFDDVTGQHMTKRGTRAYVQHLLGISPVISGRGSILDGAWTIQPVNLQDLWGMNSTLAAVAPYVVVPGGLVQVAKIDMILPLSPFYSPTSTPVAQGSRGTVRAGTEGIGQGLTASFTPGRKTAVLEFNVGVERPTHDPETALCRVKITVDGNTLIQRDQTGWMRNYTVPLAGANQVTVEVTSRSASPWNLLISETTLRSAGVDAPKPGKGRVVCLGDSWMAWYDGEFGKALAAKTGSNVINHSLGGMTTEWGLAWWDEYVTKEKPDEVWIHFFTNDLNRLTSDTFVAPDGSTRPMWTTSDIDETHRIWRKNIWEMIRRGQEQGIRVVVVMPSATVGWGQTQRHMDGANLLELPPLDHSYIASAVEANDPTWHGNLIGKYEGKPLQIGSSTAWAEGGAASDAWKNPTTEGLQGLQRVSLNRASYVKDPVSLYVQDWGTEGSEPDITSIAPVARGDKFTVNWATNGAGGHRIAGDVSVIAGREYLSIVKIIDASGSLMNDSGTSVPGAYSTFPTSVREIVGGSAYLIRRDTASATGTRYIGASQLRSNGSTMTLTVTELAAVDLTALLLDAPNLSTLSDKEIAEFALSLS